MSDIMPVFQVKIMHVDNSIFLVVLIPLANAQVVHEQRVHALLFVILLYRCKGQGITHYSNSYESYPQAEFLSRELKFYHIQSTFLDTSTQLLYVPLKLAQLTE